MLQAVLAHVVHSNKKIQYSWLQYLQVVDRIHDSLFHQGCDQQLYSSLVSMLYTCYLPLHASRRTVTVHSSKPNAEQRYTQRFE
jgi:hypothetical protein